MSGILGDAIVLAVLAVVVALAVRSLRKSRKKNCGGDCSKCGGCH